MGIEWTRIGGIGLLEDPDLGRVGDVLRGGLEGRARGGFRHPRIELGQIPLEVLNGDASAEDALGLVHGRLVLTGRLKNPFDDPSGVQVLEGRPNATVLFEF